MSSVAVAAQTRDVITRLVQAGLSVRQFYPGVRTTTTGKSVGELAATSVALRDYEYTRIYEELDNNDSYHVKMPDGGLLGFQYFFSEEEELKKHRLTFFPPSALPTVEEAPLLYENDELYGDIILNRIVRFPIRFDYDPKAAKEVVHPKSHITLGHFENCRIPVSHPVEPHTFTLFILRNFYHRSYLKYKNLFDKKSIRIGFSPSLFGSESRIAHLVVGRGTTSHSE